jgi:hypothetical protein
VSSLPSPPARGAKAAFLAFTTFSIGCVLAVALGEATFRILGLDAHEAGRIFRISDGADLQFPGRAGHRIVDLYGSNPRGTFPVDLNDAATRTKLIAGGFARVDEARATNPFGVPFSYNSRGFRDREFAPKPAGVTRVVVVGDSFTEAQGVVESASAVRLIEAGLRRTNPNIEVWNLGVRGYDFPDLEKLLDTALELSPDAVLFAMVLNDGDRSPDLATNWPRVNDWIMVRQRAPTWIERRSNMVAFAVQRYEQAQVSRDTTAWYNAIYSDANRDGWMRTRGALMRAQAKYHERGIAFGVSLWPLLVGLEGVGTYPFKAAHAQIKKGVERSGLPFLDLLPLLRGRPSESLWVHSSDLHPNEIAQELVAPGLTNFVRERLLKPANPDSVAK